MQQRRLVALVVLLTLVPLSGCLAEGPSGDGKMTDETGPGRHVTTERPLNDTLVIETPPLLTTGTTFRYTAEGPWALGTGFHVVVAETGPDGHFMAGAGQEDLTHAILEGSPLFGHFSPELGKLHPTTGEVLHQNLDFPLHDGKEWTHGEWRYQAHAAELDRPGGDGPGFLIQAVRGKQQMTYEWSPELGFFVSHVYEHADRGLMWSFRLDAVLDSTTYTWFDYTAWGWTGDEANVTTVTVPEGTDTAYLEAYGARGARLVAVAPDGREERFETTGRGNAIVRSLDAVPGEWVLAGIVPPDESATLGLVTVAWEEATIAV